jgi:hypothetical protein
MVGVAPGRFSCTAQEAIRETHDGLASRDSSLTCTLLVPQPARLQMDQSIWGKACNSFCFVQVKVLRTQEHLITHFVV